MTKNDFINLLADAIQFHEGWEEGSRAYRNWNPGNLKYVGQMGARADADGFLVASDYYTGREFLYRDLLIKFDRFSHSPLSALVAQYAPPSENDTARYVKGVVDFFSWRNWDIAGEYTLTEIMVKSEKPTVLVCLNRLHEPLDWHESQKIITLVASHMVEFGFVSRLSNELLKPSDIVKTFISLPQYPYVLAVSESRVREILSPLNEGQPFNIFFFNTEGLVAEGTFAGGGEYVGKAISSQFLTTSFSSVAYHRGVPSDDLMRVIWHELIHELFTLTGDHDILHEYQEAHHGYENNSSDDLHAVYALQAQRFFTEGKIATLLQKVVALFKKLISLVRG